MAEYTPRPPSSELEYWEHDSMSDAESVPEQSRSRLVLRLLNGCTHLTASILLLAIMAGFMKQEAGHWQRTMR